MKHKISLFFTLITLLFLAIGCMKDSATPIYNPASGIGETNLIKIEDALNHANSDFVNLLNKTRGSVGTNGPGSKVIWSKKNDFSLGLFVSANHVYGITSWSSLTEEFVDITSINNGIFLGSQIPPSNGSVSFTNELNANFGLYHPSIPPNATNTTIFPKDDFYLGILDNQRVVDNGLGVYPDLVQTSIPLQMFDPNNRTLSSQTWSTVTPDKIAIAIGYPQDKNNYPNGAVSSGKIYSDIEAQNIINSLNQNNDPEGDIPYNAQVEFLAKIDALPGMSGGGVFNNDGQLLGIMVRATVLNGEPVLRVIRMTYIKQKLMSFFNALTISDKNKMRPFISGELD